MTRQIKTKKIVTITIVVFLLFSILSTQALAATGYFTGPIGVMNALNGGTSAKWPISSGTLPTGSQTTCITITFRVSAGSAPVYLFVQSPNGTIVRLGPFGVGTHTVTICVFNGENPQGTWYVWIQTTGLVSTATATIRVNYQY